jgi:hypothetical protein
MLRRTILGALILLAICLVASQSISAQKTVRLSSAPTVFRTFYKQFTKAVNRGVGSEIAAMTSFPFQWGFDAGDEGVWNRKQFLKEYGKIFLPQPIIFKRKDPQFTVDGATYTMTNGDDASYFTFKKKGGTYKLTSYIVEP